MKKQKGFTLIELLVVIAIIGVLSSVLILVMKPSDQINKAKAAKIAKDLKLIEKAFQLTAADDMENYNLYPTENELGLSNPMISVMVNGGHLKYVSADIEPDSGSTYGYDNDNDPYPYLNNCPGGNTYAGANIVIRGDVAHDSDIINNLDKIIDNSDGLGCGKLRTVGGETFFSLSDNN